MQNNQPSKKRDYHEVFSVKERFESSQNGGDASNSKQRKSIKENAPAQTTPIASQSIKEYDSKLSKALSISKQAREALRTTETKDDNTVNRDGELSESCEEFHCLQPEFS